MAADESLCTLKATNTGQRPLYGVSFALPYTSVSGVTASSGGVCTSENGFGVCRWTAADGSPTFLLTQTRTVNVTTTPPIQAGTTSQICGSGHPQFAESYCVDANVATPSADLALELFSAFSSTIGFRDFVDIRVVVTNHGPDTSPSAVIRFRSNRRVFHFQEIFREKRKNMGRCTAKGLLWTCRVLALAPRETAVTTLAGAVRPPGDFTTVGTVTGALADPKLANNRDSTRARFKR